MTRRVLSVNEKAKAYLLANPLTPNYIAAKALGVSEKTVRAYRIRLRAEGHALPDLRRQTRTTRAKPPRPPRRIWHQSDIDRIDAYLVTHQTMGVADVARALRVSTSIVQRRRRVLMADGKITSLRTMPKPKTPKTPKPPKPPKAPKAQRMTAQERARLAALDDLRTALERVATLINAHSSEAERYALRRRWLQLRYQYVELSRGVK